MSDQLSDRLAAELAVCEAATGGPWYADDAILENFYTAVYYTFHNGDTMDRDLIADVASSPARDGWEPDAEFIAAARTGYPKALRALQAVMGLHRPEKRWQLDIDENRSYDTISDAEDMCDGTESGFTYFEVCAECKTVEESSDGHVVQENGYLTSLWPCPTIQAIQEVYGDE